MCVYGVVGGGMGRERRWSRGLAIPGSFNRIG